MSGIRNDHLAHVGGKNERDRSGRPGMAKNGWGWLMTAGDCRQAMSDIW